MNNSHCKPAIQSPRRSLWTRKSWTPLKKKKKKNTRIARSISSSHRGRRDETSTHSSIHPLGAWETVASPSLESTNAKKKKKKNAIRPLFFLLTIAFKLVGEKILGGWDGRGRRRTCLSWSEAEHSSRQPRRSQANITAESLAGGGSGYWQEERERKMVGSNGNGNGNGRGGMGKIRAGKIKEKAYGDGKWASPFWFF